MRRLILTGALMLAAGCTTTVAEMKAQEPREVFASTKTVPQLEGCLAEKLSAISTPSVIRGEDSTTLNFGGAHTTTFSVTLKPQTDGTRVEVRQLLTYTGRWRDAVHSCS